MRVAAARTTAQATGLRLWGMVEDPPRPSADGSSISATSVCMCRERSRAILPRVPVARPRVVATSATRSRCECHGRSGRPRPSSSREGARDVVPLVPQRGQRSRRPAHLQHERTSAQARAGGGDDDRRRRAIPPPSSRRSWAARAASRCARPSGVARCSTASRASASASRASSASSRSRAWRSCSTNPVSRASWLVAPQCTKRAASGSSSATRAVRRRTRGMTGLPASAASRPSACDVEVLGPAPGSRSPKPPPAGTTPVRARAAARAASKSSIPWMRAPSEKRSLTAGQRKSGSSRLTPGPGSSLSSRRTRFPAVLAGRCPRPARRAGRSGPRSGSSAAPAPRGPGRSRSRWPPRRGNTSS